MTADPYARLDAAYLLGALDADERLSYEAHLVTCWRCRASLAEISAIAPLLAGLDESVFATPPEAAPTPVPDTLLSRLLKAAGRERARRRWLSTGLGLLAAACAIALIVIVAPSSSGPKTGTPGNGRARGHSGPRHHRPAAQTMGHRDRPDLLVPTRRCRAAE